MFGVGAPPASLHSQHQQRAELPCAEAAAPCSPQQRHSPKPSTAPDTPALCSLADSQGSPVPCPAVLFQPRITFPRYKSALTVSAVLASARCLEHVELGLRGEGSTGGGGGDGAGERRSSSSGKKKKKLPLLSGAAHAGRGSLIFPSSVVASPVVPRPCSGAERWDALPKSASHSPASTEAAPAASPGGAVLHQPHCDRWRCLNNSLMVWGNENIVQ